jgi:signal transduction histidine kinase
LASQHASEMLAMLKKMEARTKAQGVRKLRAIMARMTRTQIGFRLYVWGSHMRMEMYQKLKVQQALQQRNNARQQAVEKLKNVLFKMVQGAVSTCRSMRISVWLSSVKAASVHVGQHCIFVQPNWMIEFAKKCSFGRQFDPIRRKTPLWGLLAKSWPSSS